MEDLHNLEENLPPEGSKPGRMSWGEKVLLTFGAVVVLCLFYITLDANKYRAEVRVIEGAGKVGVNPTTELLDFGDLSRGTSAVRRVSIENNTGLRMWIGVMRLGSITDLLELDKNYFTLEGHANERIEFTVYMPASGEVGQTYSGRVFVFRVPVGW